MAGGDIGGDGSVQWRFRGENVRRSSIENCFIGDTGFEQSAVDETPSEESFTVSVKIPRNADVFVRTLREAAENAAKHAGEPGYLVSFVLPIEAKNPDQIQVRWKSLPLTGNAAAPRKGPKAIVKRTVRKPEMKRKRR
jgi:hypothetical protein